MTKSKVCYPAFLRRVSLGLVCLMGALSASAAKKTNVIYILADDLGYGEVGYNGL